MVKVKVERLCKTFGERPVLKDISFCVEPGEWFCILGPNGSGKTTLLHMISGVERPTSGQLLLDDRPVQDIPRKTIAKSLAVLQQDALPPIGFTVREVIEMGRYPYQNWFGNESGETETPIVDRVLDWLKLRPMEARTVDLLSGGERQRVALGKAMAQESKLLLLDEPTTFLDIGYQVEMMDRIRKWQQECGLTVISVLHDLNLAAQYCDRLLLLHNGRIAGMGTPEEVMGAELLERVYGTRPYVLNHPDRGVPQILLGRGDA